METTFARADLKARARADMSGQWGLLIPVTIFINIISIIIYLFSNPYSLSGQILSLLELILMGPLTYAASAVVLRLAKGQTASLNDFFSAFSEFERSLPLWGLMLLKIFLWSLLFIIPGFIKSIAYSKAFYLKIENPELSASEALALSEKMTYGYKVDMLVLYLSFIGWYLLGGITFGLAYLYVYPYVLLTDAELYLHLKVRAAAKGIMPADKEDGVSAYYPMQTNDAAEPAAQSQADPARSALSAAAPDEDDEYSEESSI